MSSSRPVGARAYDPHMNADGNAVPTPPADHELRMSGRGAFYSFSFDLGADLDLVVKSEIVIFLFFQILTESLASSSEIARTI